MKFLGIIPARYSSTRLEGKPLKLIEGHTMIEWVYKRAKKSNLDSLIVATDDERIYNEVLNFGGQAIMTSTEHTNGTSRIAEVCEKIKDYDVIINIQGDEPLIEYEMINSLIETFKENKDLKMATLKHKLTEKEEIENPNNVKVICDKNDYAIYFSRSVIPYPRKADDISYFKHIGIYGYKRDFVIEYSKMPATALEIAESLEQLRVLENGYKIKVLETTHSLIGVDTQENLEQVINYIKENFEQIDSLRIEENYGKRIVYNNVWYNGIIYIYFSTGELKISMSCKNGLINGKYVEYYKNGNIKLALLELIVC